jgi:myosin-5
MVHMYEVGTRAWQPDPTEGWIASEVVDRKVNGDKVSLVFSLENGEVRTAPDRHDSRRISPEYAVANA